MKMKKKKPNENQFRVLLLFLCSLGVKGGGSRRQRGAVIEQCSGLGLYPGHGL